MASNPISNTLALTKIRVLLATRNRMFLFFSLAMPLGFLFFFVMLYGKGHAGWTSQILGAILTLTVMGGFWGLSVQLVTFREQGILRRFRLAPLGAGPMLASSILANYLLLLPPVVVEILTARYMLHSASWGNPWAIFLLVTIGSATFASFGLVIASVTNTMQETQIINQIIWMAFLFLSGATIPLSVFPEAVQRATLFLPATYLATGLEDAATNLITGREFARDAAALLLGLFVAFEVSRRVFRWEPEAKMPNRAKGWVLLALVPFLAFGIYQNFEGSMLKQIRANIAFIDRGGMDRQPPRQTPQPQP